MPDPTPFDPSEVDRALAEGLSDTPNPHADALAEMEQQEPNPPLSFGDRVRDTVDSVNAGIGSAFHETFKAGAKAVGSLVRGGERITSTLLSPIADVDYNLTTELGQPVLDLSDEQAQADGSNYQPRTVVGSISKSGSQFVTGFIGAGKLLKATRLTDGLTLSGQAVVTSAVADALAFDPHQDRLSNLVNGFAESHPSLSNPISQFLAADPTDSEAEGRLKNALEGMMLGVVVDKFFMALRATRQALRAKPKDAQAILEKAAEELEAPKIPEAEKAAPDPSKAGAFEAVEDLKATPKDAPLISAEGTTKLLNRIKDNPDWLPAGTVDKGRDFNFAKMDSEDGAKLAIDELSDLIAPEITKAKGGIQSFKMLEDMADVIGSSPEELAIALSHQAKDAPQQAARLVAGKELLQSVARRVSDLARQLNTGNATKATEDEFVSMTGRMANLQASIKAVQTGAARATAAGRIRTRDSFTNEEIRLLIAADGNPKAVAALTRPLPLGRRSLDAFLSFRVNALLSSPVTHARNMIGGALNTIALPVERMIGGALTSQPDVMKNGAHIAMALHQGIWDALKMAGKSLKVEEAIIQPFVSKLDSPRFAISAQAFDVRNPTLAQVVDVVGKVFRIPTRFLQAEDEFVKQINYRAQAVADATQAGIGKGLEGNRLAGFIEAETRKAFNDLGNGVDPKALEYANRATFTSPSVPGSWTAGIEKFAHDHPMTRLVLTFIRTPSNIMKGLWFRSPGLNLLSKEYRANLAEGGTKKADAIGQMATGALMWSGAITLALQGKITGGGPSDPRVRQTLMESGWRPYSFKVGDEFVSYNGIDPTAMFLGIAADIADASGGAKVEDLNQAATAATIALAKNLTSKTYLYGLTQALNALSDPDRNAAAYLRNFVASNVPSGLKKVAGLFPGLDDPYMRETRSLVDALRNRIPGLSTSLPPKRNIFGEPVPILAALGPDLVSPFFSSTLTDDKAKLELARFGTYFAPPDQIVSGIDLTTIKNEKGQSAYDRQQELIMTTTRNGRTLKAALSSMVTSDYYQKWKEAEGSAKDAGSDPRTLREVRALIAEYRQESFRKMTKEFPQLVNAMHATKQAEVRAKAGREVPDVVQKLLDMLK